MINSTEFAVRLQQILDYYQLTAAAFADKIDVQRSSISHLLSGRNKPSLDFVMKVVKSFKEVEMYWLINGKGTFPNHKTTPIDGIGAQGNFNPSNPKTSPDKIKRVIPEIERIVIFYTDGTFKHYKP